MINSWCVLYSHSQECFHIETIQERNRKNLRSLITGVAVDYIDLGDFISHEDAKYFIVQLDKMRARENIDRAQSFQRGKEAIEKIKQIFETH